ncbi:MAG: protein phosphatase 2C domain-containing protein [Deltaproteobacteria bacterium]
MSCLDFASRTHVGHIRTSNQDALGCYPDLGLFLVADGMGGHANGERAAQMAVEEIPAMFRELAQSSSTAFAREQADIPDRELRALNASIVAANHSIFQAGAQGDRHLSMGTTVVALVIDAGSAQARWAHVGDSRLYRLREGALELLTADHTKFGQAYAEIRQPPVDLPHTNQLQAAVGISPQVRVSSGQDTTQSGDCFLLCTDGISGMLPAATLHELLRASHDSATTADELILRALDRGGRDNASVIVVRID